MSEAESDRAKYEDIVKKLGNVDDIPPKGGHLVKSRRTRSTRRKNPPKRAAARAAGKHLAKPRYTSAMPKKADLWQPPAPTARDHVPTFPASSEISARSRTFEDRVSCENTYSDMIALVRNNSEHIDFGLSWRVVPKNIAAETARFSVPADSHRYFEQPRPIFSNDIDMFFRSLSHCLPEETDVPLV